MLNQHLLRNGGHAPFDLTVPFRSGEKGIQYKRLPPPSNFMKSKCHRAFSENLFFINTGITPEKTKGKISLVEFSKEFFAAYRQDEKVAS